MEFIRGPPGWWDLKHFPMRRVWRNWDGSLPTRDGFEAPIRPIRIYRGLMRSQNQDSYDNEGWERKKSMSISWKKRGETSPMKTARQWWRLPREAVRFPSLEADKTGHPWATQPDPRAVMLWIGDWTRDWMWSLPTWIVLWFWIYSAGYYQEHPRAPRIISYITYILQIHFNVFSLLCYQYLVHCLLYTDIIPALQTCHQGEKNVRYTF